MSWQEFKPTVFFLLKFVGIYVVANLLYGAYVTRYRPHVDGATREVTVQSAWFLSACGWPTTAVDDLAAPTTNMVFKTDNILAVYEGCNGINVAIIFIAFLVAFGPMGRNLLWFSVMGLFILHVANLGRIVSLFWVAVYMPDAMYFTHKYLFTAFLYLVVFVLWIWWVRKYSGLRIPKA
ncbi:exosortase family protein XrtF [Chryseolinea lacunae]|uniref:Exosortase family protein XrtF n=1 Tax=Chryseolinea lacunae TaxID=2801331 RepID=A0ABS1KZA0_9BACT|nr:exosortase family protein XrtF [Chryseolinea lacunae]MBL0744007.1 exosortase family protein XrtF [Chryseolinea lacunae]